MRNHVLLIVGLIVSCLARTAGATSFVWKGCNVDFDSKPTSTPGQYDLNVRFTVFQNTNQYLLKHGTFPSGSLSLELLFSGLAFAGDTQFNFVLNSGGIRDLNATARFSSPITDGTLDARLTDGIKNAMVPEPTCLGSLALCGALLARRR